MKKLVSFAALCLALGACGAKTAQTPPTTPTAQAGHDHAEGESPGCPMHVPGVVIAYEDAADGAAIAFTLPEGDAAELQGRVAHLAEKHNGSEEHHADHVAHAARAENNDQGARLILTPKNPGDLEALRTHVREHAAQMQRGECPMKEHGEHGGEHGHGEHGHGEHGHGEEHGQSAGG